jgi:hypothetical protein
MELFIFRDMGIVGGNAVVVVDLNMGRLMIGATFSNFISMAKLRFI